MLARCARCQGTFTTEHFGRQTCPHCGSELLLADPNQPLPPPQAPPPAAAAGGLPPPPPPGGGWVPPPPPPGPPTPGPDLPSPFAERSTRGFFKSFFETWKLVATEPQKFFARVRIDQVGTALFFGVLASWVGGAVGALLETLSSRAQLAQARSQLSQLPPEFAEFLQKWFDLVANGTMAGAQAVLAPIMALLSMFVMAGIVHVLLLMFQGASRGFSATLTVVAFSFGLFLISAVPQCGAAIAWVWLIVVQVMGLAAIHRAPLWKALTAVLAPAVICCCCGGASLVSVIVAAASRAGGGGGGGVTDL